MEIRVKPEMQPAAERFVALLERLLRFHPKLVFPDERPARLERQLRSIRETSGGNPEDRAFLFRILSALHNREHPPTMGELSAELDIPLSSATRMADGLVRAKLVRRRADRKDRRVVRLCMTERGDGFIDARRRDVKERVKHLLRRFSAEEQEQLIRLLSKLVDSLQAEMQ